jgi:hypothetical protein
MNDLLFGWPSSDKVPAVDSPSPCAGGFWSIDPTAAAGVQEARSYEREKGANARRRRRRNRSPLK